MNMNPHEVKKGETMTHSDQNKYLDMCQAIDELPNSAHATMLYRLSYLALTDSDLEEKMNHLIDHFGPWECCGEEYNYFTACSLCGSKKPSKSLVFQPSK